VDDWVLAADHHSIVSSHDLGRAGLRAGQIPTMVDSGRLTPLTRGWYSVTVPGSAEERHVLATRALIRAWRHEVLGAHHSALLVLGLPTYLADLSRVRLARRTPGPTRTRPSHSVGRAVPVELQHDETVMPALAVVQHGLSSGPLSALVAADAALHRRWVTPEDLSSALVWARFHPRSAAVKGFLALADGRRESPGETRVAHALHLMRLPAVPQYEVSAPGFRAVVDFMVEGENLIIEFDGRVKYGRSESDPDPFGNRRSPQEVLWAEKPREDRLRELGYEVVRVTWSDLDDLVALASRLRAALHRSRLRRVPRSAQPRSSST
jgi:very-short-patch-repair endonuclease